VTVTSTNGAGSESLPHRGPGSESECAPGSRRALRMPGSGWLERLRFSGAHASPSLMMAHFVLVACAMCASACASRRQPDSEGPCGACDVAAAPRRCQLLVVLQWPVLARQLLWQRLVLVLVWRIGPVVRLEWRVALAECYLRQAHRRTDLDIAWSRCTSGCRTHDSSGGRWLHRI
jgi:hypothetical protein